MRPYLRSDVPASSARDGVQRNTTLPRILRIGSPPPTIIRQETNANSASGSSQGDSETSDDILSEDTLVESDGSDDEYATATLRRECKRLEYVARRRYEDYRLTIARLNTKRRALKEAVRRSEADGDENSD